MKNIPILREIKILKEETKQKLLKQRNTKLVDRENPYVNFEKDKETLNIIDDYKPSYIFVPYVPVGFVEIKSTWVGTVHHEVTTISPYSVPKNNNIYCQNNANTYQ